MHLQRAYQLKRLLERARSDVQFTVVSLSVGDGCKCQRQSYPEDIVLAKVAKMAEELCCQELAIIAHNKTAMNNDLVLGAEIYVSMGFSGARFLSEDSGLSQRK